MMRIPMSSELETELSTLREAIQAEGILFRPSSLGGTNWNINLRPLFVRADILSTLAQVFWTQFQSQRPFQVCGLEFAAVPLVSAIVLEGRARGCNVNAFILRKERKSYSGGNLVEGKVSEDPAICVDDLLNSGSSMERVARVLENHGVQLKAGFVVVDFQSSRGMQWRMRHQVPILSVFSLEHLGLTRTIKEHLPALSDYFETIWHWSPERPSRTFYIASKSRPALSDCELFFGTDDGKLIALDIFTGRLKWTFTVNTRHRKGIWSAPLLAHGRLYFGAYDGNVYCLDASSGNEVWRLPASEWVGSSPCHDHKRTRIYIGLEFALPGRRGALAAVDCNDGHLIWSHPVPAYQHGSPLFDPSGDCIYFGSNDGRFSCIGAETGEPIWDFQTASAIKATPALGGKDSLILFGTMNGTVFALDAKTGKERFRWQTWGEIHSAPLVVGDFCCVSSTDKYVYFYDLSSGVALKRLNLGSRSFTSPVLIEGRIFIGTASGAIAEIDVDSLEIIGGHQLLECVTSPVCFDPRTLTFFVLCNGGEIFAFRRTAKQAEAKGRPAESSEFDSCRESLSTPSTEGSSAGMFALIGRVPNIELIAAEVEMNSQLFSIDRSRQEKITVQRETEFISLRRAVRIRGLNANDNQLVEDSPLVKKFPVSMNLLRQIANNRQGKLDRAMIVKLQAGGRVYPHVDEGIYYSSRDRFHLVVKTSDAASILRCGSEQVEMGVGDVWWLNNKKIHSSENRSSQDRIHIVFDISANDFN